MPCTLDNLRDAGGDVQNACPSPMKSFEPSTTSILVQLYIHHSLWVERQSAASDGSEIVRMLDGKLLLPGAP